MSNKPVKKKLTLELSTNGAFLVNLKNKFINKEGYGFSDVLDESSINNIIRATLNTLNELSDSENKTIRAFYELKFKHTENTLPPFYDQLMENIDLVYNRRIHTATLERYTDFVVKCIIEEADKQTENKNIVIPALLNSDFELQSIIEYIEKTWQGLDKFDYKEAITNIWNLSQEKTKNVFDEHTFLNLVEQWREERDDFDNWTEAGSLLDKTTFEASIKDDKISHFPLNILMSSMKLNRILQKTWDYEKNVRLIMSEVKTHFPEISKIKPIGWAALSKDYNDYDGMEKIDSKLLNKEFKGLESKEAGSYTFPVRISLPHVMYDSKCQGRNPLEVLVGAILGQSYSVSQQNNSHQMLNELLEIKKDLDQPQYYQTIVTKIDVKSNNPIINSLLFLSNNNNKNENYINEQLNSILEPKLSKTFSPN